MKEILIIDDELAICDSLTFLLEDLYKVFSAQNPVDGYDIISKNNIDVVLLDLRIGEYNGLDIIPKLKEMDESIQIIMMTAYASIQSSVQAMKKGATHYITKPLDSEELLALIESSMKMRKLSGKVSNLQEIVNKRFGSHVIIGESNELKDILNKIDQVKDLNTTVLITGESGTGKDLIAKALHFDSYRSDENLQIVNCAAIPDDLLESELFGYEKGAFTGADKKHIGKIELANNGTLFLDEIAEMDYNLQAKILRVVEDMKITPLGSQVTKQVNVRIVAATNKNLEDEIKSGRFREDLYYRLNVVNLHMPPLRNRDDDIISLTEYFLSIYSNKFNKKVLGISDQAKNILRSCSWPGNIRELENLIERIMVFQQNEYIDVDDIPNEYKIAKDEIESDFIKIPIGESLENIERMVILETLEYNDGNRKKTAEILSISPRALQYKIKEYQESANIAD